MLCAEYPIFSTGQCLKTSIMLVRTSHMHTVFLCVVTCLLWLWYIHVVGRLMSSIFPYPSGLFHWCCDNVAIYRCHWSNLNGCREHSVYGLNQYETTLHCNTVSRWLGPYTECSLGCSWNRPVPSHSKLLRWRHNDHDGVSNHQPHGCLLNRLFRRRSKKTSKLRVTGLCVGNWPGPVNSPHKGPVTRKMFPFDDVIMRKLCA